MSETIGSVMYTEKGEITAVVQRLTPGIMDVSLMERVLNLQNAVASHTCEDLLSTNLQLLPGTIARHLRPGSAEAQHQLLDDMAYEVDVGNVVFASILLHGHRIPKVSDNKGLYQGDMLALATVRPYRSAPYSDRDDALIESMLVHPAVQLQGLGRMAIHGALTMGEFNPKGRVIAHALVGDDASEAFYTNGIGLEQRGDIDPPSLKISDGYDTVVDRMVQSHFETPPTDTVATTVRRLETQRPWLSHGIYLDSIGKLS